MPPTDLVAVHDRLREILEPYRARLVATKDGPEGMSLEIPGLEGKPWGYVAGTRVGKRYVSLYLMAAYAFPDIGEGLSAELRRRKQGKSCFNFTTVDEALFAELDTVIGDSFERYVALAGEVAAGKARASGRHGSS